MMQWNQNTFYVQPYLPPCCAPATGRFEPCDLRGRDADEKSGPLLNLLLNEAKDDRGALLDSFIKGRVGAPFINGQKGCERSCRLRKQ